MMIISNARAMVVSSMQWFARDIEAEAEAGQEFEAEVWSRF